MKESISSLCVKLGKHKGEKKHLHGLEKLASSIAKVRSGDHAAARTVTQVTVFVLAEGSLCPIFAQ